MKKILRIFPDFITAFRWSTSIREFLWKFGEYCDNDLSGIRNLFYRFKPTSSVILHNINLKRKKWKNWGLNIIVESNGYYFPETLKHIQLIIQDATKNEFTVKPIGSGHSFTDIVSTNGYLVNTHRLNRILSLDKKLLRTGVDSEFLVEMEGGITIRDINKQFFFMLNRICDSILWLNLICFTFFTN